MGGGGLHDSCGIKTLHCQAFIIHSSFIICNLWREITSMQHC